MTRKTAKTARNTVLADVRRNRRALRSAGLSSAEIQMLEEVCLHSRATRLRKLRGSYLGNALGISRQWANALLRRLADLGLIIRFKTGLCYVCPERVKEIKGAAVKRVRRKQTNWLKGLRELASGNNAIPKGYKTVSKGKTGGGVAYWDASEGQARMSNAVRSQYWAYRIDGDTDKCLRLVGA